MAARAAAAADREHVLQLSGRNGAPARRPSRPARWALALAATLGVALVGGIGIGRSLTDTAESAAAPLLPAVAPAFRPAPGWSVVGGGIDVPPGTHAVLAANVPIDAHAEPLSLAPQSVLATLPADGVFVAVSGRAVPGAPERTQLGRVPLTLRDAEEATRWVGAQGQERALAEYVLATRAHGLDLDVRVFLGTSEPSRAQLAAAQAQLDRLVVRSAANDVTIAARPTLVRWGEPIALSGAVAGGKAGERVMIEVRECGTDYWRAVDAAITTSGGQWFSETMVGISGALRARTDGGTSAPVQITARPGVILNMLSGPRTRVSVVATKSFWRREVVLQRYAPARQRWIPVQRVRIAESDGAGNFIWNQAYFTARLTKGTLYRAVISNAATGPCYLAGFSNMARR